MTKKTTKRALLTSVISMLICVVMLVGTTFAWFTDSVSSVNNIIKSGNLDIELEYSTDFSAWNTVAEDTELFKASTLWEPGHTEVVYLKVINKGTLDVKYQLSLNVIKEIAATNVYEETFKLSQYLQYGVVEDVTAKFADRDAAIAEVSGNAMGLTDYNSGDLQMTEQGQTKTVALVVYMPTTVGNEANYLTGTNPPEIHFGVNVVATQLMSESDSFGIDYDKNATYIPAWDGAVDTDIEKDANGVYQLTSAAELAGFAQLVNGGQKSLNAVLTTDINLEGQEWMPLGGVAKDGDRWSSWYSGSFDGQGHTIYGMTVTKAKDAGFIGLSYGGTVQNLNIEDAYLLGGSYASGIVGYGYNTVKNCSVKDSTMLAGYAGSIVSYRGSGVVDCYAENNMIVGWYCAGGIVGLSGGENGEITGNTVKNCDIVLVDYMPTTTYRGAGEVVGCDTGTATIDNNTVSGNNVKICDYSATTVAASAEDLADLSAKAFTGNNGTAEEHTVFIISDIDMGGADFSAMIAQRGDTLNVIGNGYTISNVNVISGADDNTTGQASMFYAYPNSTLNVSDLTLADITVTADENDEGYAAAVVGYCEGTAVLNNVDVVNAVVTGAKSSGMISGHMSGTLTATNCDVSGTVTLTDYEDGGHYAGKYIGTLAGTATLTDCTADVTIGGNLKSTNVGDIFGRNLGTLN